MNPGSFLADIVTWVRRLIKQPSEQSISDETIVEYINRFYIYDMPARLQLFELKRQYSFDTEAFQYQYQAPFNNYQLYRQASFCDGVPITWMQSTDQFARVFPEQVQNQFWEGLTNGSPGPFTITLNNSPILPGFEDDTGYINPNVIISAYGMSGTRLFLRDNGRRTLQQTDSEFQNVTTASSGVVNYELGRLVGFSFDEPIPAGNLIETQVVPYVPGTPRAILFFNNIFKLYPVPDRSYKITMDVQITPAAYLNIIDDQDTDTPDDDVVTPGIPVTFPYMSEYISLGAARKYLSDVGDVTQYEFYRERFREQENQVLIRTNRQQQVTRTPTIFSSMTGMNPQYYPYGGL